MSGIGIVIPTTGLGPIVGPLHSTGADDYLHRFVAERLDQEPDTAVTAWLDLGPSEADTAVVSHTGQAINLREESARRHVEIISSTGTTTDWALTDGTTDYNDEMTIAAIVRFPSAATNAQVRVFGSHTLTISRTSDSGGNARVQAKRSGATGQAITNVTKDVWLFVMAQVDAAQLARIRVTATEATVTLTAPAGTAFDAASIGGNGGATNGQVHIRELVAWDRVLGSTERTAVYDALKAHYTDLT